MVREGKELRDRVLVRAGRQLVRSSVSLLRYTKVGIIVYGA
jgi:hypothetical protein